MKKLKLLLMVAVLTFSVCACGGSESEQSSGSDSKNQTATEQSVSESADKETDAEVPVKQEGNGCQQELLEAPVEERWIQIDDAVLRRDYTMSLDEAVKAFQESGEYTISAADGSGYSESGLLTAGQEIVFTVYKDKKEYVIISGKNYSDKTAGMSDDSVILNNVMLLRFDEEKAIDKNTYYCRGVRGDGEGLTYDSIKELFADYTDVMKEESQGATIMLSFDYNYQDPQGNSFIGTMMFHINAADGKCFNVFQN
ncbi:MAG: hypothetical protein IJ324_07990 [Lachnospiraceae bacterium]|nr:hypothetical protein [Lachnospiraceae bacterium]